MSSVVAADIRVAQRKHNMPKEMKLRGKISLDKDQSLIFSSTLLDGTPFFLKVEKSDIEQNGDFNDNGLADGWLFVIQENQYRDNVAITLPKATLQFGKRIVVLDFQLMPRKVSIEDFLVQNHKF